MTRFAGTVIAIVLLACVARAQEPPPVTVCTAPPTCDAACRAALAPELSEARRALAATSPTTSTRG